MHNDKAYNKTYFSASDLADFIECQHIIRLGLVNLKTPRLRKESDDSTKILQQHGIEHEKRYFDQMRKERTNVEEIPSENRSHDQRVADTITAMKRGFDVIYQAAFEDGVFRGYADFLLKVDTPSKLGAFSYEISDTKLARSGKARHLVQIALYSQMVAKVQGLEPEFTHLQLGDGTTKTYLLSDYRHYVSALIQRFLVFIEAQPETVPEKCGHCGLCQWADLCVEAWKKADHLNQVANIRSADIRKLRIRGIDTLAGLATTEIDTVTEIGSFPTLKAQAALQLEKRNTSADRVICKPLDTENKLGFFRLPLPDEGDLYFDMEGYPYEPGGLEYLFGVCYREQGSLKFKGFWGHTRAGEKKAFEDFIDFVMPRIKKDTKLHIYHYADYERRALKKLMQIHGTREAEVDSLLRDQRLVDLYAVVRHAIMTSEPRYSIKNLETFYMKGKRESDVKNAGTSIVYYENWRNETDPTNKQKWLDDIERYNEEDCISTEKLHVWLLDRRNDAITQFNQDIPWLSSAGEIAAVNDEPKPRSEDSLQAEAIKNQVREALQSAVANSHDPGAELLLDLFDFYWREIKPSFWKMYEQQEKSVPDLMDDLDAIGGLVRALHVPPRKDKQSLVFTYQMPSQETRLKIGDAVRDTASSKDVGTIFQLDESGMVELRIGVKALAKLWDSSLPEQLSIASVSGINTSILDRAIVRFAASRYGDNGATPSEKYAATWSMLRREFPRVNGVARGGVLLSGPADVEHVSELVAGMDNSYLIIQGPPGTGKTYTGARVILALLAQGKRVGVCATSHKVVANLLNAVTAAAIERNYAFVGARQKHDDPLEDDRFIKDVGSAETVDSRYRLVGGTAWVFARADADQTYDWIFVDEAGQMSLANLVALSCAGKNIVLLGDQMQLGQPLQGTHPRDSGLSALQYLLREHATVPPQLGVLLNVSRRMHPDVCQFISAAVYESRLTNHPDTAKQSLLMAAGAESALKASGIVFDPIAHEGCAQTSKPEAERIKQLIDSLLKQRYTNKDGTKRPMAAENILVVAPYNAQVRVLKDVVLPTDIKIGTVDKFQGQEAEVVIVSMTTSSAEEMPRNMEFLFDRHRLNVAISRAKTLAIIVASPRLLEIDCRTPEQMALVNTLCWAAEAGQGANKDKQCP